MNHILAVLKIPAERASGFIALGEMAGALDGELVHYLPTIMSHIRDAVCYPFLLFLICLFGCLVTFYCFMHFESSFTCVWSHFALTSIPCFL